MYIVAVKVGTPIKYNVNTAPLELVLVCLKLILCGIFIFRHFPKWIRWNTFWNSLTRFVIIYYYRTYNHWYHATRINILCDYMGHNVVPKIGEYCRSLLHDYTHKHILQTYTVSWFIRRYCKFCRPNYIHISIEARPNDL